MFFIIVFLSACVGGFFIGRITSKVTWFYKRQAEKYSEQVSILSQMNLLIIRGEIVDWYYNHGYSNVIILGYGIVGERYCDALKSAGINVVGVIEKKEISFKSGIDFYTLDNEFPKADAIVVTPIRSYNLIKQELSGKTSCPIHSLEEILYFL